MSAVLYEIEKMGMLQLQEQKKMLSNMQNHYQKTSIAKSP